MFSFFNLEIYSSFSKKLIFCFNSLIYNSNLSSTLILSVSAPTAEPSLLIFSKGDNFTFSSLFTMKESILLRLDGG